jgi:cell division initiation protein
MEQKSNLPDVNFSKTFRGYSVSDVNEYVGNVENYIEESNQIQQSLNDKIASLEVEVNRLKEVESSLFRALKMSEEVQQNWLNKMDAEVNQLMEDAQKKASKLMDDANEESTKTKLLAENQAKLILEEANQKILVENRTLKELQIAQKEVASQLIQISELTIEKVKSWSNLSEDSVENFEKNGPLVSNKDHQGSNSATNSIKAKDKFQKKKNTATGNKKATVAKKDVAPKNKGTVEKLKKQSIVPKSELLEDESLPTLNKVLEAYAKTNGSKGKIGDLN